MGLNSIDGQGLLRMLHSGAALLEQNKAKVDALNVFPVPDGDTGTNMYLTLFSATKEAEKEKENHVGKISKAMSMGSLMGARGNSGVILSQVFRGMAKVLDNYDTIDAEGLAAALKAGSDAAYKAVMKPVEGTILTVVRETARVAVDAAKKSDDVVAVMTAALDEGKRVLARTPQMLPILKEAGVVDAGGQGFLYFFEGMIRALSGEDQEMLQAKPAEAVEASPSTTESLEYQYCTEMLIKGSNIDVEAIRQALAGLGDSLLVVGENDLAKVHIHSNNPGKVLEYALVWGTLHDIKIDNMQDEAEAKAQKQDVKKEMKKVGVIAVAQGNGWEELLSDLGVDKVVSGGQTMNPSTEDFLNAIAEVNAGSLIILPNNKNVIMSAQQATHMVDKTVKVIPTTSVTEAIAAMMAYDDESNAEELEKAMLEETAKIKTGEITRAVKDSAVNGLQIKAGDYIGIIDDEVKVKGDSSQEVVLSILEQIAQCGDLISLYYGAEITEEEALAFKEIVQNTYPGHDVEVHYGGQPFYQYLLSVE